VLGVLVLYCGFGMASAYRMGVALLNPFIFIIPLPEIFSRQQ
jgi:hypothetical protein